MCAARLLYGHIDFCFRSFAASRFRYLLRWSRSRSVAVHVVAGIVAARDCASVEPVSHSRDLRARGLEPRLAHDDSTCKLVRLSDYRRFSPGRPLQHFLSGDPATRGLDRLHLVPAHRAQLLASDFGWIPLWLLRLHAWSDIRWTLAPDAGVHRSAGGLSRGALGRGGRSSRLSSWR